MKKIKNIFDNFVTITMMITFVIVSIGIFYFITKLVIVGFISLMTYQPDEIKRYEYIDLNDNSGIALDCSRFGTYPSCYLEDKTTIAVKQYKEIWIPNPDKVK